MKIAFHRDARWEATYVRQDDGTLKVTSVKLVARSISHPKQWESIEMLPLFSPEDIEDIAETAMELEEDIQEKENPDYFMQGGEL